jgi:prophage tail gpP-like protein
MRDVVLTVNSREYRGWKDIRVTRSIESLSGSFSMSVSERWRGQETPWPIREGDECAIKLGEDVIITGYVDTRSMSLGANEHTLNVAGRDKAADLIDCSAVLDAWEFDAVGVLEIAKRVAAPFDIEVALAPGVEAPPTPRRVVINPGETAYDVIDRACRLAGLFPVSDGGGRVLLTRAAEVSAMPLVEGKNILQAQAQFDGSACYSRYIVTGQQQGEDALFGTAAADVRAEATDKNVRRSTRVLMVRAEGGVSIRQAQDRANWEASVRRARAFQLAVTVQGWEQSDGRLWPVNALAVVEAPFLGIGGPMLISEVTYSLAEGAGTTTELTLRPPDAFLPQPEIPEIEGGTALEGDE